MSDQPMPTPNDPFSPYPDDRAERQSRWRIVFGSLSLVVGVMGFCVQGMGVGVVAFGDRLSLGGMKLPPPPPAVVWVGVAQFAVLVVLGVLLIAGAAMLLRRDPRGRSLVLAWAIARLVMVVVSLGTAIATIKPQVDWQIEIASAVREQLRANPNVKPEQLPPIPERRDAEASAIRAIGFASLFFATWPFVMAIVLTRPKVKAEVEGWRFAPSEPAA